MVILSTETNGRIPLENIRFDAPTDEDDGKNVILFDKKTGAHFYGYLAGGRYYFTDEDGHLDYGWDIKFNPYENDEHLHLLYPGCSLWVVLD